MKSLNRISPVIAVALISLGLTAPSVASAAAAQPGSSNGIKVSPVRSEISLDPGTSQTLDVYVQNVTQAPATYQAIVNDFVASNNESGQPSLLLNKGSYAPSHSLKRYVAPIPNVTAQPNETVDVKVKISIPKGVAGGGYFGAIRFAPAQSGNSKNVSLSASVASLILAKVSGDIKEQVTISSFDVAKNGNPGVIFTSPKDLSAIVRFRNIGNIQSQPFGKVLLKKGSTTLDSLEINNTDPRGNVLPDSIRKFSVNLTKVGSFGKYTAEGNFGYGSTGQLISAKTSFYVVPVAVIVLAVIVVLALILAIIIIPRVIKSHDRRLLRSAQKRK